MVIEDSRFGGDRIILTTGRLKVKYKYILVVKIFTKCKCKYILF